MDGHDGAWGASVGDAEAGGRAGDHRLDGVTCVRRTRDGHGVHGGITPRRSPHESVVGAARNGIPIGQVVSFVDENGIGNGVDCGNGGFKGCKRGVVCGVYHREKHEEHEWDDARHGWWFDFACLMLVFIGYF